MRTAPRTSFALTVLLAAASLGMAAPPETLVPVVQVAVNYAPGKSAMISGFLVGGGRFVLTQASVLHGAYDTAVALTNTEVMDPVLERFDPQLNVAVLRLPRGVSAEFAAVAELPAGEFRATVVGAPTAFETGKVSVLLTPLAGGQRWKIVPAIPLAFRGAPILDSSGGLLGIAVEEPEGATVVGVPVTQLSGLVPRLAVQRTSDRTAEPASPLASESEPAPPAARQGAVAAAPAPEAEAQPEPTPAAPEVLERPLEGLAVPSLRPQIVVRPPREPVSTPAAAPLPKGPEEAPPKAAAAAAAKPEPPAPVRTATKQASVDAAGNTQAGDWEARIHHQPDDPQLRLHYAELLLSAGDYRKAVAVLEEAQRRFPSVPQVYWQMAHAYWHQALHKPDGRRRRSMEKNSYRKSLGAFETFLAMAPNDPRAPEARVRMNLLKQAQYGRK